MESAIDPPEHCIWLKDSAKSEEHRLNGIVIVKPNEVIGRCDKMFVCSIDSKMFVDRIAETNSNVSI